MPNLCRPFLLLPAFGFWVQPVAEPAPKPGPEHQAMDAYVGRWRFEQEFESTPFAPAGKGSKTSETRWTLGGFFTEERGQGQGPGGKYEWLAVTAYNADRKCYQQFTFDNRGFSSRPDQGELVEGTFESKTWNWKWQEEADGKRYQCQAVDVFDSDGACYHYQWSYSADGKNWKAWIRGTATRQKSANGH